MNCPICNAEETRVLRTTGAERRRECSRCGHRWTSIEVVKERLVKAEDAAAQVKALAERLG